MSTDSVFFALRKAGVVLWLDGDALRYRGPKGALTDALRCDIAACKSDLIALIRERYEERVAIMEYAGGMSRQEAEQKAWDLI